MELAKNIELFSHIKSISLIIIIEKGISDAFAFFR